MTPREINLWGLIVGLALVIAFGVYKASQSDIAVTAESTPAESDEMDYDEPGEMNAVDAEFYSDDGPFVNLTEMVATNPHNEVDYSDVEPPQDLLPDNATDAGVVESPTQRVVDQLDGGEE